MKQLQGDVAADVQARDVAKKASVDAAKTLSDTKEVFRDADTANGAVNARIATLGEEALAESSY